MALETRKRSADGDDDDLPGAKRQRTTPSTVILKYQASIEEQAYSAARTTMEELARKGLRRSIALALQKVGFEGATPDAMESFVSMTEEYLSSIAKDVHVYANSARRSNPIPSDFGKALKRHNVTTSMLQPHRKPPIPRSKRIPTYVPLELDDTVEFDLPILGDDLDGAKEKEEKIFIPASFPAFPSIHTFKYTPQSIEAVAALKEPSVEQASQPNGPQKQQKVEWPLAPNEIPYGDPKKMREAAAKEAKAGEEALRKLVRASKVASQKESWASAQKNPQQRERFELWDSAMRELIEEAAREKGQAIAPGEMHGERGREGIADHSMIVNSERRFYRREAVRAGGRKIPMPSEVFSSRG